MLSSLKLSKMDGQYQEELLLSWASQCLIPLPFEICSLFLFSLGDYSLSLWLKHWWLFCLFMRHDTALSSAVCTVFDLVEPFSHPDTFWSSEWRGFIKIECKQDFWSFAFEHLWYPFVIVFGWGRVFAAKILLLCREHFFGMCISC